jgi:hypothetical protein
VSVNEILLLVEHLLAFKRSCHIIWTDALELWILLELLRVFGRVANVQTDASLNISTLDIDGCPDA